MDPRRRVRVLSAADVRALLPIRACIEVMEHAFVALSAGRVAMPERTSMDVGTRGETMLLMPAALRAGDGDGGSGWFGSKVLSVVPGNASSGRDAIQGVIVLFEGRHGVPVALVDASAVTAIRTAAVSALATRLLARRDAACLALIGSGVQAYSHLAAMAAVRPLGEVRVWSRGADRRAARARAAETDFGIAGRASSSARGAVDGADIICTVTSARTPVVASAWIARGAHVNAVGAHRPTDRELDSDTVRRARVFVDHLPAGLAEAGDILVPIAESGIDRTHVLGDLADLLDGRVVGRESPADVTVFKSVGVAIEDLAAAVYAYERAAADGVGTSVRLG